MGQGGGGYARELIARCNACEGKDWVKAMMREATANWECARYEREAREEECARLSMEHARLLEEAKRLLEEAEQLSEEAERHVANARCSKDVAAAAKEKLPPEEVSAAARECVCCEQESAEEEHARLSKERAMTICTYVGKMGNHIL
jgi:hypothetical protein